MTADSTASRRESPRRSPQKMEFDIYHTLDSAEFLKGLKVGATIDLDGIDGFFDQYFEVKSPGEVIHFIPSFPTDRAEFVSLPLIEASILSRNSISGTVIVSSITSFETWMMELPDDSVSETDPYSEVDPILNDIPAFETHRTFYWLRPQEKSSRPHDFAVNALLGIPTPGGFRIAALTSNETSSLILGRKTRGEQDVDPNA